MSEMEGLFCCADAVYQLSVIIKVSLRGSTMFERFTEKARRVIFFGRYEASQFGSAYIESEHLLLGLLREDKALTARFLRPGGLGNIREEGREE
jgi:ATP-dependent Clp protease ATP-binding subunit ClpA